MIKIVVAAFRGSDDPTMASLPWIAAKVSNEKGHGVTLWLFNEAVMVCKKGVADNIHPVGLPPLKDVLADVLKLGVKIFVCDRCAAARGIQQQDLVQGATLAGMPVYVDHVAQSDKNMSF